jgi:hypothetical protein
MLTAHRPSQDIPKQADQMDGAKPGGTSWRVITVAGFDPAADIRETLGDVGTQCETLIRHRPRAEPPCADELLRVEELDGSPLSSDRIARRWHRPPYALPLRLARYAPLSSEADVLDFAVIGTQGERREFIARVERTAARLVQDAIAGSSRGATGLSVSMEELRTRHRGMPGWLDRATARVGQWLFSEWWSVGATTMPLAEIVRTGESGPVTWLFPDKGAAYLADPFPWPGTDRLLCEEMPVSGGNGRIIALRQNGQGAWRQSDVVLEQQDHHSYPCAVRYGDDTYFLPEAPTCGATTLYRLEPDRKPIPLCEVAPGRRLADPTLFRHDGHYWIACTDLDIGSHDNLCFLYAREPTGPWHSHRCTPAKIDICGARPAGPLFSLGDELFRPGQDCARTYGARVVIHRIDALTPEHFSETVVARLRPDPRGPFPDGLHTLAADEGRVWIDGKRFEWDFGSLARKFVRRGRLALGRNWAAAR